MAWWNLSLTRSAVRPFRTSARRSVPVNVETLEDRAVPAAMTVYEVTELQVMNQFRANPTAFANDMRSLYLNSTGTYVSPNGYAATDPVWTDIRNSINQSESTTTWRSGFNGLTGSPNTSFYEHSLTMPTVLPLAWDSGMQDGAIGHTQWMYDNCFAHAGFNTTTPLNTTEQSSPILGLTRNFPTYAEYFDLTGYTTGGENISYAVNAGTAAYAGYLAGLYPIAGYYQRLAYADVLGFMLENNNGNPASPWGHLDNIGRGSFTVVGISSHFYENTYYEGAADGITKSYFGTHRFGDVAGLDTANVVVYVDSNANNNFDVGEGIPATVDVTGAATGSFVLPASGYNTFAISTAGAYTFSASLSGVSLAAPIVVAGGANRNVFFRLSTAVDVTRPVSSVATLPAYDTTSTFPVRWSGSDPGTPSSGVASYDIYVSDNGAPATLWLNDTTATSAYYNGAVGHTYGFYSLATDVSGLTEAAPASADATLSIQAFATNSPPNLANVAQSLAHSDEAYTRFINQVYLNYLGRTPDSVGLSNWLTGMRSGDVTDEELEAAIIGSPEYVASQGGPGFQWILSMYEDLLRRTPTTQELINWYTQLLAGAEPATIAYGFAASAEREVLRVTDNYQNLLGRTPGQAEVNAWVDQFINHGMTNETMLGSFAGSSEFYSGRGQSSPAVWVGQAYTALLGRAASTAEIAAYASQIKPPANINAIAQSLTHSAEGYTNLIVSAYNAFLGRGPDPTGQAGWLNALQTGAISNEGLEAQLIGSPEYIAAHGGPGAPWVNSMYRDLLGRSPSTAETNAWVFQLSLNVSPYSVAYGFAASPERESIKVTGFIQSILGRSPAPGEVNFWVNQYNRGTSNETIRANMAGSGEFYGGVQANNNVVRWIEFAYLDLLGRNPSLAEINALLPLL